jgi:Uri superfamily endonuclease
MDETALTAAPGAYMLFIELEGALALPATSRGSRILAPGRYAYCGSAYGPGGLRARLRRHLKREKALRWHIDHLTTAGRIFALGLAPGGQECALFEDLSRHPGVEVPLAGFGSSDCASCPAHLLRIGRHFDERKLASAVELVWVDRSDTSEVGRHRAG